MWFQLNTTFSTHLGALSTLQSNYGVTYSLSNFTKTTAPDMVEKDKSLTVVLTMAEGATFSNASMTDGTNTITGNLSGNTVTMTINSVKGPVTVTARATVAGIVEPDDSTTYTITYVCKNSSGTTLKTTTETGVAAGTSRTFTTSGAPAISGYTCTSVSPTSATINQDITVTYTYTAVEIPEGANLITLGTAHTDKKLGSSSSTPTSGTGYTVYSDIPVTAGNVYAFTSCYRSWWLNADKEDLSSFNPGTSNVIAPVNAAYVSVTTHTESEPSIVLYYDASSTERPEGDDILTQGTAHTGKALSSTSYTMTDNESYTVYDQIPVEANAIYKVNGALRAWWLKSDKTQLSTENLSATGGIASVPANAAYLSVTIANSNVPAAYMIRLV